MTAVSEARAPMFFYWKPAGVWGITKKGKSKVGSERGGCLVRLK